MYGTCTCADVKYFFNHLNEIIGLSVSVEGQGCQNICVSGSYFSHFSKSSIFSYMHAKQCRKVN